MAHIRELTGALKSNRNRLLLELLSSSAVFIYWDAISILHPVKQVLLY